MTQCCSFCFAELDKVKFTINKLKKEFEEKLSLDLDKWYEYFSSIPINNKKPHKCPVCDGSGCDKNILLSMPPKFPLCKSCDGKGIVWG